MCRHGSLGRESTKDAHGVDEIAQKGDRDYLIDRLVKRVKGQGQVEKDVWVGQNKGEGASSSGEKPSILTQVQQGDCRR